jgi:hypothetical protein
VIDIGIIARSRKRQQEGEANSLRKELIRGFSTGGAETMDGKDLDLLT